MDHPPKNCNHRFVEKNEKFHLIENENWISTKEKWLVNSHIKHCRKCIALPENTEDWYWKEWCRKKLLKNSVMTYLQADKYLASVRFKKIYETLRAHYLITQQAVKSGEISRFMVSNMETNVITLADVNEFSARVYRSEEELREYAAEIWGNLLDDKRFASVNTRSHLKEAQTEYVMDLVQQWCSEFLQKPVYIK